MTETFDQGNGPQPLARAQKVVVKVNGQVVAEAEQGDILGTIAKKYAQRANIKSFAVKMTAMSGAERKADTQEAGKQLASIKVVGEEMGIASLDVIAKDTRGVFNKLQTFSV